MPALTNREYNRQIIRNLILVRPSLPLIQPEIPASQRSLSVDGFRRVALIPSILTSYTIHRLELFPAQN
jgi:hypothetical protein